MANHIDPVCRMQVKEKDAAGLSDHKGTSYYFDSEECMTKFNQRPEKYANKSEGERQRHQCLKPYRSRKE